MPSSIQRAYFAIRAFNVELACIKEGHNVRHQSSKPRETTSTVALKMRIQWWREALAKIYNDNESTEHTENRIINLSTSAWNSPVVRALDEANDQFNFTKRFLERLIDAREADLEINQYKTLDDYVRYSEESVSSLLYLLLECHGVQNDQADEVAHHAGVGIGLVTALRSTPFRLIHGEVPIPQNLLRPGFPYSELVRNESSEFTLSESDASLWNEAIVHMSNEAAARFHKVTTDQRLVPRNAKTILLPVIPAQHFLSKLEKTNFNVFDQSLHDKTRLLLLLKLARSWVTGVF